MTSIIGVRSSLLRRVNVFIVCALAVVVVGISIFLVSVIKSVSSGSKEICSDSDGGVKPLLNGVTKGENGTFVDTCDNHGNLEEYYCERNDVYVGLKGTKSSGELTGKVNSVHFDCNGMCAGGSCASRCPKFYDQLTYLVVDARTGDATFRNKRDNRTYACKLYFDDGHDTYDCKHDTYTSLGVEIRTLSASKLCARNEIIYLGTYDHRFPLSNASLHQCAYSCSVIK